MVDFSAGMLEAGMRAGIDHSDFIKVGAIACSCGWEIAGHPIGAHAAALAFLKHQTSAILAAALTVGNAREEWQVAGEFMEDSFSGWVPETSDPYDSREDAERDAAKYRTHRDLWRNVRAQHRTIHTFPSGHVLTSPWVDVIER